MERLSLRLLGKGLPTTFTLISFSAWLNLSLVSPTNTIFSWMGVDLDMHLTVQALYHSLHCLKMASISDPLNSSMESSGTTPPALMISSSWETTHWISVCGAS